MTRLPSRLIPYEYMPAQRHGLVFFSMNPSASRPADVRTTFAPGAESFARIHHLPAAIPVNNGNKNEARRQLIEGVLHAGGPLAVVAYFGHGVLEGLVGTGLGMPEASDFADAIRAKVDPVRGTRVVFYACSTGGLGGFAERLAELLRGRDVTVYGHDGAGPAMSRPNVRRFPGGDWVIAPGEPLWGAWSTALRSSDLWALFPFMTTDQLRRRLTTSGH